MAINVAQLADTPLVGCLQVMESLANAGNMRDRLTLDLELYSSRSKASTLLIAIQKESLNVPVASVEYQLNELQYEIRKARRLQQPAQEEHLLGKWVSMTISRTGDANAGLDLFNTAEGNRAIRGK